MFNFLCALESGKIATIIFASVFALLFIICLIVALINKNEKIPYDKDGFVHKVLKHDFSIFNQLVRFCQALLLVGAVIIYFVKFNYHFYISAGLFGLLILIGLFDLYTKIKTKNCRIEYNRNGLYKYSFGNRSKEIAWKDLKDVQARGIGRSRVFTFKGKKNVVINVPFKMVGAYEFIVFCEKQLDGEKFEVIKMGKARQ